MHPVAAFPAPALPCLATGVALLFPTLARFLSGVLSPLTGIFSSLLLSPVCLRLRKRGRREEHESQSEEQSNLGSP
jgi:hypothetical protein